MSWIMVSELFHWSPWILASIFLVFFHSYIWWMSLYIFIVVLGSSNAGQLENSLHTLLTWVYLGKSDFPPILEGYLVGSAQSRDSSRNIQLSWCSKVVRINQLSYLFKPGWVSGPHPEAFISYAELVFANCCWCHIERWRGLMGCSGNWFLAILGLNYFKVSHHSAFAYFVFAVSAVLGLFKKLTNILFLLIWYLLLGFSSVSSWDCSVFFFCCWLRKYPSNV